MVLSRFQFINEDFFRWARPHKGLWRDVLFVRRSQKPAENAAQREKDHLWMENNEQNTYQNTVGIRNCLLSQISYMRYRVYLTRKFKWLIVGLDLIKMYVNPLDVIGKFI